MSNPRDDDWLRLPGGRLIHLPTVRTRLANGCGDCGSTVWLIVEGAIRCPNCVRPKSGTRVLGRFDLKACKVVEVYPAAEDPSPDEARGPQRRGDGWS